MLGKPSESAKEDASQCSQHQAQTELHCRSITFALQLDMGAKRCYTQALYPSTLPKRVWIHWCSLTALSDKKKTLLGSLKLAWGYRVSLQPVSPV
jgi:hypothetical protein